MIYDDTVKGIIRKTGLTGHVFPDIEEPKPLYSSLGGGTFGMKKAVLSTYSAHVCCVCVCGGAFCVCVRLCIEEGAYICVLGTGWALLPAWTHGRVHLPSAFSLK